MKSTYLALSFLLMLFNILFLNGQTYYVDRKTPTGGFSYDGVKDIIQDKDGFMWFILNNDIIRFDGKENKFYFKKIKQRNISSLLTFRALHNNNKDEIYVSSNQGLFKYNRLSDSFDLEYPHPVNIYHIDSNNNFWVELNRVLSIYEPISKTSKQLSFENHPLKNTLIIKQISNSVFIADQKNNIYRCNLDNNDFQLELFYKSTSEVLDFDISEDYVWILTADMIQKIDLENKKLVDTIDIVQSFGASPKILVCDKNENLWIGTKNGLFFINSKTKDRIKYIHEKNKESSLSFNSIWSIKEDLNKNIWVGTFSGGVNFINLDNKKTIKTYNKKEGYIDLVVSSIASYGSDIFIGTDGDGLYMLDTISGIMKQDDLFRELNVKSIVVDADKTLWMGTYKSGIWRNKIGNRKPANIVTFTTDNSKLLTNDIRKIIQGKNNDLWIAYQLNKAVISHYSVTNQIFTHYTLDKGDKSSFLFDIVMNDSVLWAVSRNTIYEMDLRNFEVKEIINEKNTSLNGQSLQIDSNNLWIGTIGNGLLRYNLESKQVESYSNITNYATAIYSMLIDDKHQLWMSTENGILKLNTNLRQLILYSLNDGLQGFAFYPLSATKTEKGQLYFGGTNGFNKINPDLVYNIDKLSNIKVIVSNIEVDYNSENLHFLESNNTIENNTLVLEPSQNNFSVSLSSNNFSSFDNIFFKYKLDNYQEDWIQMGEGERTIFFNQLHSGNYTLQVKIIDYNQNIINSFTLHIYKKPHIWETWWAFLIYTIVAVGLLIYLFSRYNRMKNKKYKKLLQTLEDEKDKEIRIAQTTFFVNVSHDLRTPLALILATIDNLKKENINSRTFNILINNTLRLKNIVNELLDFKKIESTRLNTLPKSTDVNQLVKNIKADFLDYASINQIIVELHLDHLLPVQTLIDPNHLEKILLNIINNAFKNSEEKSTILIETFCDKVKYIPIYANHYSLDANQSKDKYFSILIRDNGGGIPKESLKSIFETYKQIDENIIHGTGIGLAVVKDLVQANHGTLDVYSELGMGTDFLISFPLKQVENTSESTIPGVVDDKLYNYVSSETVLLIDKIRVLLVEDNADLRYLIANFLSSKFYVIEAENGNEACEILLMKEIDIIISDIMMPIMDGISFLKWVKQQTRFTHLPFILLTAKTEMTSKLDSISLGADFYFDKPVDLTFLMATIDNIFIQRENLKAYFANNYYADISESTNNEKDNEFLKSLIKILEENLNSSTMDIDSLASQLNMSRSKFYSRIKEITGKTIVEYILQFKLRKAANLLIETNDPINVVMYQVGIRSKSYFSTTFKKEFGESPSSFIAKHRKS